MKRSDKPSRAFSRRRFPPPGFIVPFLAMLITGTAIILFQWAVLSSDGDGFALGRNSPRTYRVIAPVRYDDQTAAASLRKMAEESIVGVTVRDPSAKARLRRRLDALAAMEERPRDVLLTFIPEPLLNALLKMDAAERTRLLNLASEVGEACMDRVEAEGGVAAGGDEAGVLWDEIGKRIKSVDDSNLIYQILSKIGNLSFRPDQELTDKARQAAADDIPTIERRLELGDVIVTRGDTVTPQTARLLRLQGYTEDVFPTGRFCILLIILLFIPLLAGIFGRYDEEHRPSWACTAFLIIAAWCFEAMAARLHIPGAGIVPPVLASCLCARGAFAFISSLLGTVTGAFIIADVAISNTNMILAMAFTASILGFYLFMPIESRGQIHRRVFALTAVLTVVRAALRYVQGVNATSDFFNVLAPGWAAWAEYGGYFLFEVACSHLVVMLLPGVEEYIGALSVLRLRELSHPSSPLLRTLQREAPGTYQHCLTIATLIEAVAMDMGMDVNLLKAGAYYHDIGKLRHPQFYVENQQGGFNAHDEMAPSLSAITIISHVNEGVQMAWEARLPKRVRDMIAEHHGTTCVRYFYNKAVAEGEKVEWSDFCYPGPKPRSRESALLMIVDSTEAAVRSMNLGRGAANSDDGHPNRGRSQYIEALEQTVNQVVNSKAGEGQFSGVNFTHRDIERVKESLLNALLSMYHTRRVKKIEKKK